MADPSHWDDRYASVGAEAVSWYQDRPTTSLQLLDVLGVRPGHSVIDVGGGASTLVDHLLALGFDDLGVLDVSAVALEIARARIGDAPAVSWIVEDLLRWAPDRAWDVWHDRAVLHFLVEDGDRARYAQTVRAALRPGGALVIGAFAEDGPTQCSGLPVRRHAPEDLLALIGDVEVVEQRHDVHLTPHGAPQPFNWIAARLRP